VSRTGSASLLPSGSNNTPGDAGLTGCPVQAPLGRGCSSVTDQPRLREQAHGVPWSLKHFQQSGQNHYLTFSRYHRQPKLGRVARPRRRSQTSRVPRPSFAWAGVFIGHTPASVPGADSRSALVPEVGRHPRLCGPLIRWKTIVCRGHDPGGIQGDGKHSHFERRHSRESRACRRSPNRKSINLRRIAGVSEAGPPARALFA
jgi:hypothetical protein